MITIKDKQKPLMYDFIKRSFFMPGKCACCGIQ